MHLKMISICGLNLGRCRANLNKYTSSRRVARPSINYLDHEDFGIKVTHLSKSFAYDHIFRKRPIRINNYYTLSKKLSVQGLPMIQDRHKSIFITCPPKKSKYHNQNINKNKKYASIDSKVNNRSRNASSTLSKKKITPRNLFMGNVSKTRNTNEFIHNSLTEIENMSVYQMLNIKKGEPLVLYPQLNISNRCFLRMSVPRTASYIAKPYLEL